MSEDGSCAAGLSCGDARFVFERGAVAGKSCFADGRVGSFENDVFDC